MQLRWTNRNGIRVRRSIETVHRNRSSGTPQETLLIFDGECGFCTTAVSRLEKLLPVFPPSTPWQWANLDALGLSADDVRLYAWLTTPGHQYGGHLAFSALLRLQPSAGWRFLGHLIATPPFSWAAAVGYHYVAKYRHKLPGGTPACQLRQAS